MALVNAPALPQVLTALVTALGTPSTYTVWDGPYPNSLPQGKFLLVGSDGQNPEAGKLNTDMFAMGSRPDSEETGEFPCFAQSWDGSFDNAATKRADVQSILSDLAAAAYGLTDASWTAFTGLLEVQSFEQAQTQNGLQVMARVLIRYQLVRT